MFCGESSDPKKVYEELCAEVDRLAREGIEEELFRVAKSTIYGRYVGAFDSVEGVAGLMMNGAFCGVPMYELVDTAAAVTKEGLEQRLREGFSVERSALSVVWPDKKQ